MSAPGVRVEVREFPAPEPRPGGAVLAVECSEVCGTDVHLREGRLAGVPYPLIPGHVTVGRLARVRGRMQDLSGRPLREGDRVTFLDVHATCHRCWYCLVARAATRCPHRRVYGITYGAADGLHGGWAEELELLPGTVVLPLGDVAPERFLAGGCGLPTAIHALERADPALLDRVLVLGTGPVGLSCIALARLRGAARILAIGAPAERLEAALEAGADEVLDLRDADPDARRAWVAARTEGRGADVTIEVAGDPAAVPQAIRCTRDAGRVVVAGQYTDRGETTLHPHLDLNARHLQVRGCWGSDASHFHRAVEIIRHARLGAAWQRIPVRNYTLEDTERALEDVAAGRVVKALVRPRASTHDAVGDQSGQPTS